MRGFKAKIASAGVAAALVISSTGAGAAPPASSSAAATPVSQNSWLALSMLTQGGAIGLGSAAVQPTPQSDREPPPPPPPPPPGYGGIQTPPLPVIVIWLGVAAMAVYIATLDHRGHGQFPLPNSPG